MTAAVGCPSPQALARMDMDGARVLVEVLSRPDVLGKVQVSIRGERRVVPARWLDPQNEEARGLLTSAAPVARREGPAAPRPADGLRAALSTARPISGALARDLLRLAHLPSGPDRYLLALDGKHIWALCGDRVLSGHEVPEQPAQAQPRPQGERTPSHPARAYREARVRQPEVLSKEAPKPKGPAQQPPTATLTRERIFGAIHPTLGVEVRDIRPSASMVALFPSGKAGKMALRQALLESVSVDDRRATLRLTSGEVVICYRLKQYLDRPPEWWAWLESEGPPALREGDRWLEAP